MGGILQVDTIQNNNTSNLITQTNVTTITIGASGQTISIPAGATLNTTTVVLAAGAVGTPSLTTSGDTNTGIFFPSADTIAFTEGGAEAMRIDSSGRVGIGISSPTSKLHIAGINTTGGIFIEQSDDFNASPALTITGKRSDANTSQTFSGKLLLSKNQTNSATSSGIPIGTIYFGGNHTDSNISNILYSSSISGISEGVFNSSSDMPSGIIFLTGSTGITGNAANVAAGTERMRINSSGDVMIGTTTVGNNKLRIVTFTAAQKILEAVNESVSSNTAGNIYSYVGTSAGTGFVHYTAQSFTQVVFKVFGNGNVENLNNSYGGISDIKIKKDIIDAGSQWNDIKNVRVRKFRLKDDPTQFFQIGVVAQELEKVSPNLIDEIQDYEKVEVPVLDDNGNPVLNEDGTAQVKEERIPLDTTTKSVKYSVLYMKAVKALQEAMERIEQLESKNISLEARLTALENK